MCEIMYISSLFLIVLCTHYLNTTRSVLWPYIYTIVVGLYYTTNKRVYLLYKLLELSVIRPRACEYAFLII
jgi:hypothetical protein